MGACHTPGTIQRERNITLLLFITVETFFLTFRFILTNFLCTNCCSYYYQFTLDNLTIV